MGGIGIVLDMLPGRVLRRDVPRYGVAIADVLVRLVDVGTDDDRLLGRQ